MTAKEIIEAMKKNGYEKTKGAYFNIDGKAFYSLESTRRPRQTDIRACAMGQVALNLNTEPARIADVLDNIYIPIEKLTKDEEEIVRGNWDTRADLSEIQASILVVGLNDYTDASIIDIANRLEELLPA